jgi:hypothetical protein
MIFDLTKFDLTADPKIRKPTAFLDNSGFSIRLYYPNKFIQKITFRDDLFTLIKFILDDISPDNNSTLRDITISLELFQEKRKGSNYLTKDYNTYSNEIYPLDLEITNTFRFDSYEQIFYKEDKKIEFNELINYTLNKHIKNTKPIEGLSLRIQNRSYKSVSILFKFLKKSGEFLLKHLYGNIFDASFSAYFNETDRKSKEDNSSGNPNNQKLNFSLGNYNTNLNTILSFSIITTSLFALLKYFDFPISLIEEITKNNFFSLTFGIILLFFYEKIIQNSIRKSVLFFAKMEFEFRYKKINF